MLLGGAKLELVYAKDVYGPTTVEALFWLSFTEFGFNASIYSPTVQENFFVFVFLAKPTIVASQTLENLP